MSDTPIAVEVNCTTGEVIERPLTADEIAAQAKAQADFEAQQKAAAEEQAAKDAAKASAQAKLTTLGLTAEEVNAILGN